MAWNKRLMNVSKDIARTVAFLSRIPMPSSLFVDTTQTSTARQAWAYPLAGLIIGLPGALIIVVIGSVSSAMMAAILAVTITTFVTGALHEDGLADLADGFWGGWTKDRRLDIMKDSTVGAYGVLALIMWFALSVTGLADIIKRTHPADAALVWLAVCAASRAAITVLWSTTPAARNSGVAHAAGQPNNEATLYAVISAIVIGLAAILFGAPLLLVIACTIAAAATAALRYLCLRKIDGHTGDTLGAAQKVAEATILTSLAIMV